MTSTIIVPLDGSLDALVALPVAKRLAELKSASLHLVHVGTVSSPPAEVLERIGLRTADLHGSVLHVTSGEPADGILDIARQHHADLLVMCTHTSAGVEKTIGRTALAVLHAAVCPIVLVRPTRGLVPWTLQRVLLPHDGTPTTSAAIPPAAELARCAGAELTVLHVAAPVTRELGALSSPRYVDQPQHEWPAWAQEFVERLGCACPLEALKIRLALAHGDPADEVLRTSTECSTDLIVLAWQGRWEEGRADIVKQIVRDASCPVMVIRAS